MLAERIQAGLQQALSESPLAQQLCARLAGKTLHVVALQTPLAATVRCDGQTLHMQLGAAAQPADVTVSGGLLSLLALTGADRQAVVERGAVTIRGDLELAEQFAQLATLLRPDVEHLLGKTMGRGPAHLLAGAALGLQRGARHWTRNLLRSTADYLQHEHGALVSRGEADHFQQQLADLSAGIQRLEAGLARLQSRDRP